MRLMARVRLAASNIPLFTCMLGQSGCRSIMAGPSVAGRACVSRVQYRHSSRRSWPYSTRHQSDAPDAAGTC